MYSELKTYSVKQLLFHLNNSGGKLANDCEEELKVRGLTIFKPGIISTPIFKERL